MLQSGPKVYDRAITIWRKTINDQVINKSTLGWAAFSLTTAVANKAFRWKRRAEEEKEERKTKWKVCIVQRGGQGRTNMLAPHHSTGVAHLRLWSPSRFRGMSQSIDSVSLSLSFCCCSDDYEHDWWLMKVLTCQWFMTDKYWSNNNSQRHSFLQEPCSKAFNSPEALYTS